MSRLEREFGARIRDLRKSEGLTQEKLAGKAGLHYTYVGGVERGEHNVSLRNIERLARALGVSIAELFPAKKTVRPDAAQTARYAINRVLRKQKLGTLKSMLVVVNEIAKQAP